MMYKPLRKSKKNPCFVILKHTECAYEMKRNPRRIKPHKCKHT